MTKALCFRIGNIGNLFPKDMIELVSAIKETLTEMNVHLPVKS
jgi:aspartate aminotransferase-like enzyme